MKTDEIEVDPTSAQMGRAFRYYREAAGITLREMAERMSMSINPIRHHEAGIRLLRVPDIWRAAAILGVSPDRLLDTTIDPTTPKA